MTRQARLTLLMLLNLALVAGLVTAGLAAHSVAVLAAGGDYLADAAAIGVSLLAIALSRRRTARRPGGYPHATAYAALLNATLLLAVAVFVITEAGRRLGTGGGQVDGLPVLVASGIAALAMLAGGLILHADEERSDDSAGDRANMRAAMLDTLADSAAAGGVAVTGAIILADSALAWMDPAVALAISAVVGYHAIKLIREVVASLRCRSPAATPAATRAGPPQGDSRPEPPPPLASPPAHTNRGKPTEHKPRQRPSARPPRQGL